MKIKKRHTGGEFGGEKRRFTAPGAEKRDQPVDRLERWDGSTVWE